MIEVQGLSRYYGRHRAVDGLDFSIDSNQVVGFLGLNGAGKTTTLKVLAGVLMPTAGTVKIDGHDLNDAPLALRSQIGFLPETPPLHADMRVRDFLEYVAELRGMSAEATQARLGIVAEQTEITDVLDRVVSTLSHGYRKRVGIAQAILHQPKLVILDEPISGLDPAQIVEMRQIISGLAKDCTVLLSSHILAEVSQTCDRILVLSEGRIVADGTEAELSARVQGGASIRLTVRGTTESVSATLNDNESVEKWSVEATNGDVLTLGVTLTGDHREAVVKALSDAGLGIRALSGDDSELETVFLDLTRVEAT